MTRKQLAASRATPTKTPLSDCVFFQNAKLTHAHHLLGSVVLPLLRPNVI